MNVLKWLLATVSRRLFGSRNEHGIGGTMRRKNSADHIDTASDHPRNFDEDYRSATYMLRLRMDKRFPDNYHARLSSGENSTYDHGQDRALAIDVASTAIAVALRNGATVRQAAEAGAASVGI